MRFVPKGDKLVVLLDKVEERKVGGIYLPRAHSEICRFAKVLATGPEVTSYKLGERVLVNFFSGKVLDVVTLSTHIKQHDDTLRVVTEAEILVSVTGKEDSFDLSVQPVLPWWKKIRLFFARLLGG